MNISCVNDKISSVFVCQSRQLVPGEEPKHAGSDTVYEATNELQPKFKNALASGKPMVCSWKIDGTCCMIENGIYYRRRDIRKGSKIPENAVLGDVDETGHANIAWLPLDTSKDAEDRYHLSALEGAYFYSMDENKQTQKIALSEITERKTFELIGPMVQSNLYEIPIVPVPVTIMKKGVNKVEYVPRHYLIPHGTFVVPFPLEIFSQPDPLTYVMAFVLDNKAEGLVFRCGEEYFKINRGHIGEKVQGKLLLSGKKEVLR